VTTLLSTTILNFENVLKARLERLEYNNFIKISLSIIKGELDTLFG